jgi:hypothetical protein
MVLMSLAGVVALLGLAQDSAAEARYHLVMMPDGAGQVTNSGLVLSGTLLLEPARDALGNPVWDSDGDDVADGYTTTSLTLGDYSAAGAMHVNEELGVAVGWAQASGNRQPVLWTNIWTANEDGTVGTLVDLGGSHGAQTGIAMDLNSRGQVVVREGGRDHPWSPWGMGLVLVNPKDTDADGVPDLWFEDLDGDGSNDLMIDLEGTSPGGSPNSPLRINELGQIVGWSNFGGNSFVILPEDTDGDSQPDVWFTDTDGDGVNDLQIDLGSGSMAEDISDGGRIVGRLREGRSQYLTQWQIVLPGQVNLIVQESAGGQGGTFNAINEDSQVVGTLYDNRTGYEGGILWENGQMLDLIELLDNPENADILSPWNINDSGTITGTNCWYDKSVKMIACNEWFIAVPIAPSPPGPGPSVDTISPDTMQASTSVDVTISGSGFASGVEVTFENGSGPAPSANVTSVDGTTIEVTVTAHRKAKPAVWDVRVTNPDGSSYVLVGGFTVVP